MTCVVAVVTDELASGQFAVNVAFWFSCLCKLLQQSVTGDNLDKMQRVIVIRGC
jgi:hypothetical protein